MGFWEFYSSIANCTDIFSVPLEGILSHPTHFENSAYIPSLPSHPGSGLGKVTLSDEGDAAGALASKPPEPLKTEFPVHKQHASTRSHCSPIRG